MDNDSVGRRGIDENGNPRVTPKPSIQNQEKDPSREASKSSRNNPSARRVRNR